MQYSRRPKKGVSSYKFCTKIALLYESPVQNNFFPICTNWYKFRCFPVERITAPGLAMKRISAVLPFAVNFAANRRRSRRL